MIPLIVLCLHKSCSNCIYLDPVEDCLDYLCWTIKQLSISFRSIWQLTLFYTKISVQVYIPKWLQMVHKWVCKTYSSLNQVEDFYSESTVWRKVKATVLPLTPPHFMQARKFYNFSFHLQEPIKLSSQVSGVSLNSVTPVFFHVIKLICLHHLWLKSIYCIICKLLY